MYIWQCPIPWDDAWLEVVAYIKIEIPVLVQSLMKSVLSFTSSQMDQAIWGVVSAAVRKLGLWGIHWDTLSTLAWCMCFTITGRIWMMAICSWLNPDIYIGTFVADLLTMGHQIFFWAVNRSQVRIWINSLASNASFCPVAQNQVQVIAGAKLRVICPISWTCCSWKSNDQKTSK